MAKNELVTGYYNLFDSTKDYTEILFRAGKVLQSKELNEMQSILKNQIKNVGNTILTDGDIIEGCQLVISDDRHSVTLTKGRIYLEGNVRDVPDTVINITGVGTEIIGAKIETKVITADEDNTLNDIAAGYDNYNQDGGYRLQENVKITLNDENASILYSLTEGELLSVVSTEDLTQLDKINSTLARRTFEESGNYKVTGLTISDKKQNDTDYIYATLEAGKAYVRGYEVNKDVASTIRLDRASTLRSVENEPKTFRTGTARYVLNNNYVNSIKKVVSIVQVTQNITRGSIVGGIDYLPLSPTVEIVSITQGSNTYVNGTDFQLINDGVDWSIGSNAPAPGSSYSCTWTYNKTMTKEVDYTLESTDDYYNGYVKFLEGDKPVNGTSFQVSYDFKLCRWDVIGLDMAGNIQVVKGQSDVLRTVSIPSTDDNHLLALGAVMLTPMSNEIRIINNNTKTIHMLDLYNMLERINELEYNQAISDLDQEAADGENATELRGVFTDGFVGVSKADLYHPEWSASLDLEAKEMTIPFSTAVSTLIPDTENNYRAGQFGRLITTPYSEVTLLSQSLASGSLRINSYNAFPKTPTVNLNPQVDNWVDTNIVTIDGGTTTKTITLRRWTWMTSASKATWNAYGFSDSWLQSHNYDAYWETDSKYWNTGTTVVSTVTNAIMYMRQRSVSISIYNLEPNSDNIIVTFNGTQIAVSPTKASYQGATSGTLKADATGKAYGTFTVPANVLCGTVQVTAYAANTPSLNGTANYTATGNKVTTTQKVWTEKVVLRAYDPLAQSFQFENDQFLTGVGLYFLDKDLNEPITVQVRNMVNGYPGTTVYAEKVIDAATIKISTSAAQETKVTFDNPVYCNAGEPYCFTVLSNSDVDSLWIAETTKNDITSNSLITKNPYLNGTLFSSSNALTWTAHQSQDLKFNIYGAKFETSGQILFQPVEEVSFDRIMVMSNESVPIGCSINWQYSINGEDWLPIEPNDDRELTELAESVQIRVVMNATTSTSPAIASDSLIFVGFSNENAGTYISKNVPVTSGFNHVKIDVDMYLPSGSNAVVRFATDTNGTEWQTLDNVGSTQKSSLYTTYTFEKELSEKAYNYRVRIDLTAVNKINRPRIQNLKNIMKTV